MWAVFLKNIIFVSLSSQMVVFRVSGMTLTVCAAKELARIFSSSEVVFLRTQLRLLLVVNNCSFTFYEHQIKI